MSRSSSNLPAPTGGDFILYTAPDEAVKVDVFFKNETVWLTQKALAELFAVKVPAINKHLKNIFDSGELVEDSVISILETTAADNKSYQTRFYNLDAIIAVGYRVNSLPGHTAARPAPTRVVAGHPSNQSFRFACTKSSSVSCG